MGRLATLGTQSYLQEDLQVEQRLLWQQDRYVFSSDSGAQQEPCVAVPSDIRRGTPCVAQLC